MAGSGAMGAAGARYGGAGLKRAGIMSGGRYARGQPLRTMERFAEGAYSRMRRDYRGVTMRANRGLNSFAARYTGGIGGGFSGHTGTPRAEE